MKIVVSKGSETRKVSDGWHVAYCLDVRVADLFNKFKNEKEKSILFAFGVKDNGEAQVLIVRKRFSVNEKSGMMAVIRSLNIVQDEFELEECIGKVCNLLVKDGKVSQITVNTTNNPIHVTTTLGKEALDRFINYVQNNTEGGVK